jgi:hypothetical protein
VAWPAAALLGLSFRLGLQLILDPEALPQALARLQRSPHTALPPAATLDDLRQQAEATQQRLGDSLRLGDRTAGRECCWCQY